MDFAFFFFFFFWLFLNFLMSLNSLFNSLNKRFHISFSFSLDCSCFLFLFKELTFCSCLSTFLFFVLQPFFDLFLFNFIKIININRILSKDRGFISYCFIVPKGNFQLFFVILCFEDNVEVAL